MRPEQCTCPSGLHPNDPDNYFCTYCEARMDEEAEREDERALLEDADEAFESLVAELT